MGGNVGVNRPPVDHGQQVVPLRRALGRTELLGNLQSELAEARRLANGGACKDGLGVADAQVSGHNH